MLIDLNVKKFIIIDFQWYRFNSHTLIPKELASCDGEFRRSHFIFKPVMSFGAMAVEDQRVARYAFSQCHGLKWEDGYVNAGTFDEVVKRLCMCVDVVFVKGREKLEFLKCIVDKCIVNLVDVEKITRGKPSCSFHVGNYVVCALSNVEKFYTFLLDAKLRDKKIGYI